MTEADIETDYLVVGAGISGLSFADELLTRSNASITIVDERDAPGGHWNDAYPFVQLHQPSNFYGVESTELTDYRIEQYGPNKGLMSLASKHEILSYCHALMRDRLLPSGRVIYLPSTAFEGNGTIRAILSGKRQKVSIRKKLVVASRNTNVIPLHHKRAFAIAPSITCIPPNDLPRLASKFSSYTVLGAGKTALDTCRWLLSNDVDPDCINWVVPRDAWFVNRAKTQSGPEFFTDVFGGFVDRWDAIAQAKDATDLALRFERSGFWIRLDSNVETTKFSAATVSVGELEQLRQIKNIIRKGKVVEVSADRITLTGGSVAAKPDTLYIDCTASALPPRPLVPIFQPNMIVVQVIRSPQIPFSAALTAFLESLPLTDEQRNSYAAPVPFGRTVEDFIHTIHMDLMNRAAASSHPEIREWVRHSRLDGYSRLQSTVRPNEKEKLKILAQLKDGVKAAGKNMPRLLDSIKPRARL